MPATPPRTPVLVPRARDRAVRPARNHGAVRTLLVAAAVALALAVAAVAQAAPGSVSASQLKSGFRKATGQKLVVDTIRSSAGHYTAFNLGVQTGTRQARYGTFTIYLVTDPDVATQVQHAADESAHRRARHAGRGEHLLGARPDDERHRGLAREAPVRGERRPVVDELQAGQEDGRHVHDPPQGTFRTYQENLNGET